MNKPGPDEKSVFESATGRAVEVAGDLGMLKNARRTVLAAGMTPVVIAPTGGLLEVTGAAPVPIERTFATARSVEFDAILLAGAPAPAADAAGGRDAKAGDPAGAQHVVDPRITLLLAEAWRHAKPLGAWDEGEQALRAAGILGDAAGVVLGADAVSVLDQIAGLLAEHRVWDRFPPPHASET